MGIIFAAALIARVAAVATFNPEKRGFGFSDAQYLNLARNVHDGRGFYTDGPYGKVGPEKVYAFRPPLFPFVWGLLYGVTGGRYEPMWYGFAVMSAFGCVLAYRAGIRLIGDERASFLGGLLCAVYPPLVFHGVNLMTEPFFIFFSTLTVLFLLRTHDSGRIADACLSGLWFGLAVLSRSVLIGFAPVSAAWLFFAAPRQRASRRMVQVGCFAAAIALTLAPWVVRNAIVLHDFVPTTTDAGHGFYAANNPLSLDDPRGFNIPNDWGFLLREGEQRLSETEAQRRLTGVTLRYLAEHPALWLKLALKRVVWFWRPWPNPAYVARSHVILYAVSFVPLAPFIVAGLVLAHVRSRAHLAKVVLIDLLIVFMTAAHAFVLAMVRYREPLMPLLLLFAAIALSRPFSRRAVHAKDADG